MGGAGQSKLANNPMDDRLQKKQNTEKRKRQQEKKERKRIEQEQKRLKKLAKKTKKPITPILVVPSSRTNETEIESNDITKLFKKQLSTDSESFIINQLLFSVEFFRNYQRDIQDTARLTRREQDYQTKKISQYNKRVLIPDRILQSMEKYNKFRYRHGPMKGEQQPIQRFIKYIIFDNIEIIKQTEMEDEIYSKIEDTTGRPTLKIVIDNDEKFNMVDSKEHPGFYRLRNSEIINLNKYGQHLFNDEYDHVIDDEEDDDEEEISHETKIKPNRKIRDSIAVPKTQAKRIQVALKTYNISMRASSSTPSPSSSEYDYTYITNINSHRSINEMRTTFAIDEPLNALTIPQSCFIKVKIQHEEDEDDDDEDNYNKKTMQIKLSFHSKTFFYYFTNAFKSVLAQELGFEQEEIDNATWKGASIFIEPFEIIPAIQCKWPEKIAYDFSKRSRTTIKNHATGRSHQWPPQDLIKHIINRTQCHIIPNGYAPKEGVNPQRDFEWQIVFPVAEQLLESNLSNAQLKIYIIFKLLIKTFIEPLIGDKYNLTDHIRHHLFWLFERTYPLMSDEFLGERLIHILNTLLERIGKTTLYDFFLPSRNLLYNIPSNVLIAVHEGLYRISEFPARHLIIALRNLQVVEKEFYPRFNYKKLFEGLTVDALAVLNPQLSSQRTMVKKETPQDMFNDIIAVGAIGLCEQQAQQDKRVKRTVRFNENKTRKRKESTESIREFRVEKQMDEQRRQVIFELFIPHFIEMAKASANFESFDQSLLFLKQAENLCKTIAEDNYNTQPFMTKIKEVWHTVIAAKVAKGREVQNGPSSKAPPLPRRESLLDPKQQRRATLAKKSVTIQEVDDDPYTNIDLIRSSIGIPPAEYSDSDEDEQPYPMKTNGLVKKEPRKSILTNTNRPNGIRIEQVQVHTPRPPTIDDENNNLPHNNKIQWSTNNTTTKKSVNIANRRKSSTKFVQMSNGCDDSEDSNDNENENTKTSNNAQEFAKATTPTKTSANIANRRKSSTKFVQISNGFDNDSDDSVEEQIHTPKQPTIDSKNEELTSSNKVQEPPNSSKTTKTTANISTRRKSSTKFNQIHSGHISDDSDESDAEDTSF